MQSNELSFEEAFVEMARDQEALAEVREMEGTIGDGLEQDCFSPEPRLSRAVDHLT